MTENTIKYEGINSLSLFPQIIEECLTHEQVITTNKKIKYYNVPCAFDIETTSFYTDDEKGACMYEWTLGINGAVVVGRRWKEFIDCLNMISETLKLDKNKRVIIYVHNLAFEFQFLRKWLTWEKVFAANDRKPIYALTDIGIEFRCSYILSGYSLESLGKQLRLIPVEKMVGDLDYTKPRHYDTPLSEQEWKYCENDVRVVMNYITERIVKDGDITKIPYTKTGYVRRYCRNACYYDGSHKKNQDKWLNYRKLMESLTLDALEYEQLKRAFQGGFTHANAFYSGVTMKCVASFDFTSSYPAVMLSEQFPMSKGEIIEITDRKMFDKCLSLYCCLFDIEFINLESISLCEHPLSASRCWFKEEYIEDNGRIVSAQRLRTTLTEQDFAIMQEFYRWDAIKIGTFRRYKKAYLPKDFILSILKLYENKTTLKNVEGQEEEYMRSKEMINSCYGMCVTDICRDEITYGTDWGREPADHEKTIERENKSKKRFLFYPWGVWITAYARRNLFSGIKEFGNDYIYSDTDSLKVLNADKHMKYINGYNENITKKLEACMNYNGIPVERIRPKTIEGKEKPLGVWDYEGEYELFRTLGAKRYMTKKDGKLSITVSGVNKGVAVPYLLDNYGIEKSFDVFTNGFEFPNESTGKLTHTYIDDEVGANLTDYLGTKRLVYEKSCIHLEKTSYNLTLSDAYMEYLCGITNYSK